MIIAILRSDQPKPGEADTTVVPRLMEAGRARGHEMIELFEPEIVIRHTDPKTVIEHKGSPLPAIDVIINRPSFVEEPSLHTVTTDALQRAGYKLVNGHPLASVGKNKLAQHLILSANCVPMPAWAIARTPWRSVEAAKSIGFPVVIKVAFGRHGKGVFLAENEKTLLPIVDYLNVRDKNPVIIEKFIEEAAGTYVRAFVVGDKVVAAKERKTNDDVRANAAFYGENTAIELTDEERRIALGAAKAFDLDIAGVDLLRSKNGPLVLEVNASPGFESLEETTGIDVAGAIIDFAASPQ